MEALGGESELNRLNRGGGAGNLSDSTVVIEKIVIYGNVDERNARNLAEEVGDILKRESQYIRSL